MSRDPGDETDGDESLAAPSLWQRHDLGVLIFAFAIFAGGVLLHRSLTAPKLIEFRHEGLAFDRPGGWLPGVRPAATQAALASKSTGFGARDPKESPAEKDFHIVYSAPRDARQRIEVRVSERPAYSNLGGVLAVRRLGRYGEFYWVRSSRNQSIGRRDWVRSEYRYAFKASKNSSPQIAEAVEYATLNDGRLYVVTLHGSPENMKELDNLVAKTLRVEAQAPGGGPR